MFARVAVALAAAVAIAGPFAQARKSSIVTVLDPDGAAVKGVSPADLTVRKDTATREVVEVKPATEPMTIAPRADNTKPTTGQRALTAPWVQ
jgi:hypothetical protein